MLCSETLFCFERRWLLCFQKNMGTVQLHRCNDSDFLTGLEVINRTCKGNKSCTPVGFCYPWKTWYSQVGCFILSEGLAGLAKVHRNSCQRAKEGTWSATSPMNITSRRPQTWWKPSGAEPYAQISCKKSQFLLPSPLQIWKQTYWRVMQTSQSYWACSKLWKDGQRVKCGTLRCHFALMKGKQEFVWFRNLTTLILPSFVDFPWIKLVFSSRHLYRHWEVLKYVCMVYELTERYICYGSSEAVF